MKNRNIILLFPLLILLVLGCTSKKHISLADNNPIFVAIEDFVKNPKHLKNENIFSIHVFNINESVLAVSILDEGVENKFNLYEGEKIIGTAHSYFPTDYIEIGNKFFYWNDSSKIVSQEIFDKIKQYDLLEYDPEKMIVINDDSKKAIDYYFCKNNLKKFKKVVTRIAIGWYTPPELYCD